jgi:hypothetical protein
MQSRLMRQPERVYREIKIVVPSNTVPGNGIASVAPRNDALQLHLPLLSSIASLLPRWAPGTPSGVPRPRLELAPDVTN